MPEGKPKDALAVSGGLVGLMLLLEVVDALVLRHRLDAFGIQPRSLVGLWGIIWAPLLHASFTHWLANALPLFVLLLLLWSDRQYRPARALCWIWVASGVGTWLIGRSGPASHPVVHLGASSLIYGVVAYLIVAGVLHGTWRAALLGAGVLLLYGGIFVGVLPSAGPVSWEGHLSGALAGAWAARELSKRGARR